MDLQKIHKQETANLIGVADQSARIFLNGTLPEQKEQLLKRLKTIDEQYKDQQVNMS